ncbi:hypothetical protein [Acinetobacter haemolyticus]|uniref:Integral membrane protein n=3 Tax=Acinetobacter haemolyticus TaxID=29430 RepID=A0A4P7B593_ACIHA|nr:hypothetical protein [Acinetobacter haemolyticus]EFF82363.1 hypothetical protein HMP0015_2086 [Acinetobacter haemolyticus ATCC 19194]ENW19644.1 hypothetical protein F927_01061 [Acinetobacter haemolyticus CIP 64.3 = MTCC 9819]ENW20504.1 hypothetical protein F926_01868 [Acinetobacter haemolyticus NIPH 261]EPR88043.1 putative integral membrane protein [Acinetobacter haemolyticus CIP 64.3 = MTCC 9819]MBO3656564.1 hypothetical protein [Acinetobacter haemolyticus]
MYELKDATQIAIVFSGVFLWIGMLTGVWKYYQIRQTEQARAHYYVDIAHRSSLLYAAASLILAVLSHFTILAESVVLFCVLANLFFFAMSILTYIIHGLLKDTTNQFKRPHQLGRLTLPTWSMTIMMLALIIVELGATGILLLGTMLSFWG